ncbi:MAG: hypothetical protein NTY67_05815 [Cyanobacteria bacterium]|nr:hypothetical protein [Cyanobacteriota bacterium]
MTSSSPCCEIRQLLVHGYPGGSKSPGAERIADFCVRRGCSVNKPRSMPAELAPAPLPVRHPLTSVPYLPHPCRYRP